MTARLIPTRRGALVVLGLVVAFWCICNTIGVSVGWAG